MRFFFSALALAFFLLVSAAYARSETGLAPVKHPVAFQKVEITGKDGQAHFFEVEIAATPEEMARGLMFRKSMPENHGMIFVFGNEALRSFWMKNTLIPLDILFIDADGKIVKIYGNAKPLDETPLSSGGPVFAAIELNGGVSVRLGIAVGDVVHHDIFGNSSEK